jgi:ribulose-phosphate 3-epimerase
MKMPSIDIAPSILSADFGRLAEQIRTVEQGGATVIHVDVMDGHFVPNLTLGLPVVRSIRRATSLRLDAHLMIEEPDRYIEEFAKAGVDMISVHVEAVPHLHRTVTAIRALGASPGVVLNPATPVSSVEEILPFVDFVVVMSVNPGFGGQKFIDTSLDKVRRLRGMISDRGLNVRIEIDGGIGPDNVGEVVRAGVEIIVAGSAVFDDPDPAEAVRRLRRAAEAPFTV